MLFTSLKPMLPVWGEAPFDDGAFLFEPKWDGARMLLHKREGKLEAYTRSGMAVAAQFPELREAAGLIRANSAILDCEAICMRDGRPVFDDIMYRLRLGRSDKIAQAQRTKPAAWVVFDVLMSGDAQHLNEPLADRKRRLDELLLPGPVLIKTMYVENQGKPLFALTERQRMEGIVAKRKTSLYMPDTRSPDWLKIKHPQTIDTVILGYRNDPFALIVGLHFRTVKNKPVATVEDGLLPEHRERLLDEIAGQPIRQEDGRYWVEPKLCCRIEYKDRTDAHQLRFTRFIAFVLDKKTDDCVWAY
ncbi:DNA ligase [Paenibacillus piri]|uniref:DNA ligase n=1 Tax=Paenibacillus piri TaxID=2547395 RepID=A0A4R5KY33_9BACL|nr:DNA ligase [Paenibacillus piri]TDG00126.1 DNA ligase [Paenibacillus piri]